MKPVWNSAVHFSAVWKGYTSARLWFPKVTSSLCHHSDTFPWQCSGCSATAWNALFITQYSHCPHMKTMIRLKIYWRKWDRQNFFIDVHCSSYSFGFTANTELQREGGWANNQHARFSVHTSQISPMREFETLTKALSKNSRHGDGDWKEHCVLNFSWDVCTKRRKVLTKHI